MSLRVKLVAIVLFVGLVPLVVSSLTALRIHQHAYDERVLAGQRRTAAHLADRAARRLQHDLDVLALLAQRTVRWGELDEAQREGALWLVYRQVEDVAAAALFDGEGRVASAVWMEPGVHDPGLAAHPRITRDSAAAVLEAAPVPSGTAIRAGTPVAWEGGHLLPLAIPVGDADPQDVGAAARVALALSLRTVCLELAEAADGADVRLVDRAGTPVCDAGSPSAPRAVEPALLARASAAAGATVHGTAEDARVTGFAPLPSGWMVFASRPASEVFAASRRIRAVSAAWIAGSLFLALASGLYLAGGITGPVARLAEGARELARGNFGHRLPESGRDELAGLAATFNRMGIEIEKRDGEIRAWNRDLQARVDERTAELRHAQEQLLQSEKIAAVTSLGAGIAHEMNSPLAGVLALSQVLLSRARKAGAERATEATLLADVEKEALRLRDIVQTFGGLCEQYAGEGFVRTRVNDVVEDALRAIGPGLAEAGATVDAPLDPGNPEILADRAQIREALFQVLENARIAVSARKGRVTVTTDVRESDRLVRIVVEDDGPGIPETVLPRVFEPFFTTKENWRGEGLGLTVAYRAVQRHHGTIRIDSGPGRGTRVVMTFPSARARAHLV